MGGGECGAGGYVYLYTRSARPPIGTNVFLTAYKDVEFEVVEDLDDSTPCGSQRSAREHHCRRVFARVLHLCCLSAILAEGAIALLVTLSGSALFAS